VQLWQPLLKKFLLKYVFRKPIISTKQVAPYANFACLDGCHLTGKFKGMLICATNQDSNGKIFILAHGGLILAFCAISGVFSFYNQVITSCLNYKTVLNNWNKITAVDVC